MKNLGLILLCLFNLHASAWSGRIEIVQSVPIETSLAVAGVPLTQSVWVDLINSAQTTIDLEEFYVSSQAGSALEPVLGALQNAASRGVQIRLLIDAKFYGSYPNDANALGKLPNVKLKTIDFSKSDGVMHAKYFVIDGKSAYLGSANFDWLALSHIHEIGLKINDVKIAADLESVFNFDWSAGISRTKKQSAAGVLASPGGLVPSGIPPTLDALVTLINSAKSSIKIQNYEYNTAIYQSSAHFQALDAAIRNAASRGVQVSFLLDQNALKAGSPDLKTLSNLKNIQLKMIRIPAWSGGPLAYARLAHSKYCLIDNATAWVGSENWSSGYFNNSRNVGLIFSDSEPVAQLDAVFQQLWASPYVGPLK